MRSIRSGRPWYFNRERSSCVSSTGTSAGTRTGRCATLSRKTTCPAPARPRLNAMRWRRTTSCGCRKPSGRPLCHRIPRRTRPIRCRRPSPCGSFAIISIRPADSPREPTLTGTRVDAGRLTLTVQDVTAEKLVLKLDGDARLQQAGRDEPSTYQPAIFGYLEYDRAKKRFTRFDMLALGTASGLPRDANGKIAFRKGAYPVGIAFELVTTPTPAERLHPRGARDNPTAYLQPK